MGSRAIKECLDGLGVRASDVDMLCCISSTGFMLPGLTAMFVKHWVVLTVTVWILLAWDAMQA